MTQLLASVTTAEEAELAILGGADLIDLKNPTRGTLGALSIDTIRAIRDQVGGRRPVSATIGDLPADPALTAEAIRTTAATGVDLVKVGFFSDAHLGSCLPVVADLADSTRIVAVLFADGYSSLTDPGWFSAAGCAGLMLDTADKSAGGLLDRLDLLTLKRFVDQSRGHGLMTGLAGSLRIADIQRLGPLSPDYLGFRGALCREGQRIQALDPRRLQDVRQALDLACETSITQQM
jgi:(5-formylfuran-3-yl)methyl phosphate synthase